MKIILPLFLLIFSPFFFLQSMFMNHMSNKIYEIERYQISPSEKVVYGQQMTGGTDVASDGSLIHWDGYEYVPIKEINFDTTSLMFIGGIIDFKEFSPLKTSDFASLEVIFHSIGNNENYTVVLSQSDNKVIVGFDNGYVSEIDIKGYEHVRDVIFKNERGELFYIPFEEGKLSPITLNVDEATLRHATYNYYYDKNGLYIFGNQNKSTQCLESSNGKDIEPVLSSRYLAYGDAIYPYGHTSNPKDLKMNAETLMQFSTPYDTYITDGNQLFRLPNRTKDRIIAITPKEIIQENTPGVAMGQWQNIAIMVIGGNLEGNNLYFSSKDHYTGSGSYYSIIKTPEGFFGITGSSTTRKAVWFSDVLIWDETHGKYESIDPDQYRKLTINFYIYKNRLYYTNSNPVKSDLDLENLHPICHNGKSTEFFTDGKYLVGGYNFMDMIKTENGEYVLQNLFNDVDWATLKVLKRNYMADKNNLYKITNTTLEVIPIKDLGLNVIIK